MKRHAGQSGLSLIELLVAVTIGLALLAGVISIVINSSRTQRAMENVARQIENGRYAMDILQREIPHAGYYGEFYEYVEPGSMPNPCNTTINGDFDAALGLPIQGYDSPATPSINCLGGANHVGNTDILVVRRASTAATDPGDLTANEVYLQARAVNRVLTAASGPNDSSFDLTTTNAGGSTVPADIRKFHVDIYFIGPDDDGVPTLQRLRLAEDGGSLGLQQQALVSGIENMQIDYGMDTNGDGSPDTFDTDPSSISGWADVVGLRVHLIARDIEPTPGHSDSKTYHMGEEGTVGPMGDEFRRRAYVSTIRAINPSIRRE